MSKPTFHLMFEQSGTFKKEFQKLGYRAIDYDILNDFGQTDVIIDLFQEINKAYNGEKSLFDEVMDGDIVMAFFPCIRFENQALLLFRGENSGMLSWSMEKKLEYCLTLHDELHELYSQITKLAIVSIRKGFPLIIENPYSSQHYLQRYWCLKPKLIDKNRMERGDWYEKPTQYWFINCEPKENFIFEPMVVQKKKIIENESKVNRSMISPDYASRFIREFIIEGEEKADE